MKSCSCPRPHWDSVRLCVAIGTRARCLPPWHDEGWASLQGWALAMALPSLAPHSRQEQASLGSPP